MIRRLCMVALALACMSGCSRMSFVKQRLDNFSAYYNTFYNAELALEEGVSGFNASLEGAPVDQSVFISLFGRSQQGTTQRKPFEDAILKCADVLRDHPNSKWVDDATLCIGKAWFYTLNFVGAEQKFREILALDSPLKYEARFWLARTYIAGGSYDDAYDHLQATLAGEDLSRRWEPQYRLALAELHVTRGDWDEAAQELEVGLPHVRDSDLASRAQFLLGQVYEALERYDDAVASYDEVQRYKPWYELSYAAQYSAVRVLAEHGNAEVALLRLRKMERDDKNYEYRARLSYLRARVHQVLGDYDEALDLYYYLLYDEDGKDMSVRGPVHYALALYFRDVERDFQYAAAHFDTAATAMGRGATTALRRTARSRGPSTSRQQSRGEGRSAPGAITDSDEQARIFGDFSVVMDRILLMDSLLYVGSLDDSTFDAMVMELRQKRAEELTEMEREEQRRLAERGFRGLGIESFGDLPEGKDIGQAAMGFLYHRDEIQMQLARNEFVAIWGDRPLARNWRRIAAVMATEAGDDEAGAGNGLYRAAGFDHMLPTVDVSDVPRDSASQARMREKRAQAWYELGNVLFLSINMHDSAAVWYRRVIETSGTRPIAQRAYYALAEVQRALGDRLGADRLYREIVVQFPGTQFAVQAAERLGMAPVESVVTDSLLLAEALYTEHHAAWRTGSHEASMQGMIEAAQMYPATAVAPRALLAAGSIYMDWVSQDSLDLFGPLPLPAASQAWIRQSKQPPVPDSVDIKLHTLMGMLSEAYPGSAYARPARGVIAALDERWAEIMAPLDSLRRLDSLAVVDSLALQDSMAVMAIVDSVMVNDSLLAVTRDSLLVVVGLAVLAAADDSLLLVASDSLMAAARDVVFKEMRDSLYAAVRDSIAATAAARIAANERARADSIAAARGSPGMPRQLRPSTGNAVYAKEPLAGVTPSDPGAQALGQQDPSLGNIDWSKGGYTIVVHKGQQHEAVRAFAANYGRTLQYPVDIFSAAVGRGVEFRVGVGLFETLVQVQSAMQQLQGQLPEGAEIVRVPAASRRKAGI